MNRLVLASLVASLLVPTLAHARKAPLADDHDRRPPPPITANDERPLVQVALLLDTSGSMQGLIEQTKAQLWQIVNELATARRDGKPPRVQVALYEYGKDSLPREAGFLRRIVPLTEDLDRVSAELTKLTTNGGDEYCGRAIHVATHELSWSKDPRALKMIFIAGNEPFTQGPVKYEAAVKAALGKGITVNTIHCGDEHQGVAGMWKRAATLGDGRFAVIDHNARVAAVVTPHDAELERLGRELNGTYLGYGRGGAEKKARQAELDEAASGAMGNAGVARAAAKASTLYKNDDWDVVDAVKAGKDVLSFEDAELPAELRGKSKEEKRKEVEGLATERSALQGKIAELESRRRAFVANEAKKRPAAAAPAPAAAGDAMVDAIREQGKAKGFAF